MLQRFLPSVVTNTPPQIEVIVADNGSTDNSRELLRCDFPDVKVICLDKNYGFAEGYNRALKQIEADYYVLLNSDVETPAGWIEPLIRTLDERDDVVAVAPKLLSVSDRQMFEYAGASGGFIDAVGYPFCRGRILDSVERDAGQYDDAREVMWATGACLACRASNFWKVGGLDGSFFAHQEEIDLCWRLQLAGQKVMVEPRSVVYHLGAGTLPPSTQKLYFNYRNNLAMLYKDLTTSQLLWVLPTRFVMNAGSSIVYLLRGEVKNFATVWHAYKDFWAMRNGNFSSEWPSLKEKRRQIQATRIGRPSGIYRGWIVLDYLFGRRQFDRLKGMR